MIKRIICFFLSILLILSFTSCGKKVDFISTDNTFIWGMLNVVSENFAVYQNTDKTIIYKINRKKGKLSVHYTFNKSLELVDAKKDIILFKTIDNYLIYNLSTNTVNSLNNKDFPLNDNFCELTLKLNDSADKLIVTRIVKDENSVIKAGNIVLGYKLKNETGIYLYSLEGNVKSKVLLESLGVKNSVKLEAISVGDNEDKLGVVLRYSAIGTSFADEAYYSVDFSEEKIDKIGEYKNSQSIDTINDKFSFLNYYCSMNSSVINLVDFSSKRVLRQELPILRKENDELYISENGKNIIINGENSKYIKCEIGTEYIEFNSVDYDELSKEILYISNSNAGARVNIGNDFSNKFSRGNITNFYKTYNSNCFVAEKGKNFCIVYK